jgi:hypothetical protein
MRRLRILLLASLLVLLGGAYFTLRSLGVIGGTALVQVQAVPAGDQEIAWINPATNSSSWERFVSGVRRARDATPGLSVDLTNAFPDQTAAVPEVVLTMDGCPQKLWIRWYKQTSEVGVDQWIQALAQRRPAPLAIIGGGSSDRARDLAKALAAQKPWQGDLPLLMITTATADKVRLDEEQQPVLTPQMVDQSKEPWQDLMDIYPGRSFRFCFTNRQMAEAVIDFVWSRPDLRPSDPYPALSAVPYSVSGDPFGTLAWLMAGTQPANHFLVRWLDDPYSIDLTERFREVLDEPDRRARQTVIYELPYSVGGYDDPNRRERMQAGAILKDLGNSEGQRSLLVLPAVDRPVRRLLRALTLSSNPKQMSNLVVLTGDAISFNTIYRDRDIAWNIQEMPLPLVMFCHQNPVAWREPKPGDRPAAAVSATDDVLLNADIVRVLVKSAFECEDGPDRPPRLLGRADQLAERFRSQEPPFFEANGDREGGGGETIVCLLPRFDESGRVLPNGVIEVWQRQAAEPPATGLRWQRLRELSLEMDDPTLREGNSP